MLKSKIDIKIYIDEKMIILNKLNIVDPQVKNRCKKRRFYCAMARLVLENRIYIYIYILDAFAKKKEIKK